MMCLRRGTGDSVQGVAHTAEIFFTLILDRWKCLSQLWSPFLINMNEGFHGPHQAEAIFSIPFTLLLKENSSLLQLGFHFCSSGHSDINKNRTRISESSQVIREGKQISREVNKGIISISLYKPTSCFNFDQLYLFNEGLLVIFQVTGFQFDLQIKTIIWINCWPFTICLITWLLMFLDPLFQLKWYHCDILYDLSCSFGEYNVRKAKK